MQDFQFLFELFTLLLGLAVAEILRGFSGVLKLRARRKAGVDPRAQRVRIGWLVPLLGAFVILDQASFWLHIYVLRDTLPFNFAAVVGILILIGSYYLLSTLIFPDEPELWPDFDAYYQQQKPWVLWGVVLINIASSLVQMMSGASADPAALQGANPAILMAFSLITFAIFPLLVAAAIVKGKRTSTVLLVLLVAAQLAGAVLSAFLPIAG